MKPARSSFTKGESALMIRYGDKVAVSNWSSAARSALYLERSAGKQLHRPAGQCEAEADGDPAVETSSDEEFLRRVYYDTIGLPPTPEEVRAFLADTLRRTSGKDDRRPAGTARACRVLGAKWADLLKIRFDLMREKGTWGMYRWIRDSIAVNKPFDWFVREMLRRRAAATENHRQLLARLPERRRRLRGHSPGLLGMRLLCAKCHDHPFEKWVQKDYYGMSAFFSQVGRKPGGRREDVIVYRNEIAASHAIRKPTRRSSQVPGCGDRPITAQEDAREMLAKWLTRKDNPFFAKATVNRLWSHLFGKGIIDPVDDIRSSNPPVNGPCSTRWRRNSPTTISTSGTSCERC